MSNDNKRVINPLLNASVTGATLEDYTQNAVLFPAKYESSAGPGSAHISPFPSPGMTTPFAGVGSLQSEPSSQLYGELKTSESVLYRPVSKSEDEGIQQFWPISTPEEAFRIASRPVEEIIQPFSVVTEEIQPSVNIPENQNQEPYLSSVLSSFSNLLNIGSIGPSEQAVPSAPFLTLEPQVEPSNIEPVPLIYNSGFGTTLTSALPAGPLTSISPLISTPPTQGLPNSYRRTTKLGRPKYAPIPGLSDPKTGVFGIATQVPQAQHLPSRPPTSHSPLAPFQTHQQKPILSSFQDFGGYAPTNQQSLIHSPPNPIQAYNPASTVHITPIHSPDNKFNSATASTVPVDNEETLLISTSIQHLNTFNTTTPILSPIPYFNPSSHAGMSTMSENSDTHDSSNIPYDSFDTNANMPNHERPATCIYRPVYNHWFHKKEVEGRVIWSPFTMLDSIALESAFVSHELSPEKVVATDGGRYDVNILRRERISVYWESKPSEVRRCSWFHKSNADGRYVPYDENIAQKLEEEFKVAFELNAWNRKVDLANGETVIFHGPDVLVLFPPAQSPDSWGNTPNQPRPRVVKRGVDEFDIDEGESSKVDHLLFLVHGIGSVCDLKFRSVEEVVDEFRSISLQLVQAHYRSSCEKGMANRVEVLPISWHEKLHSADTGVDSKLQGITLESIPRLRAFTNDTILDVLFYTSPVYCQTIIQSVGNELNRIFELFKVRNPSFEGGVSLGGHSLGSLILFDLLCHQHPEPENSKKPDTPEENEEDVVSPLKPHPKQRRMSRRISYMMGAMGTGQPQLNYPHLVFNPKHFFALGSPIGMFVTVRGLDTLGEQFSLPTCPAFFNIFHPYDPVAYRIESLVNPELAGLKPVLIPHHKGRKRMHLELKETMARVGADLKQKLIDSMKNTWNSFYQFSLFKTQTNPPNLEEEVDKVLEESMKKHIVTESLDDSADAAAAVEPTDLCLGSLNQGKRIDYVLQEAPLEFFNEYIFALTSHVCYWESEDTMLLILKEIYSSMNIATDSQIPQQTMTIERTVTAAGGYSDLATANIPPVLAIDPTMPIIPKTVAPPPTTGFVRKA